MNTLTHTLIAAAILCSAATLTTHAGDDHPCANALAHDDGTGNFNLGPSQFDAAMLWGNSFETNEHAIVETIEVSFGSGAALGTPFHAVVLEDPNDDGDPTDGILRSITPATVLINGDGEFQSIPIDSSAVNGSFFIAVLMDVQQGDNVARMDPQTLGTHSWLFFDGEINFDDLGASPVIFRMSEHPFNGTWMIRTTIRPAADISGNGTIDVDDLLQLLAAWGDCTEPCAEDINGDGGVDVDDLLFLLSHWGPCQ